MLDDNEARVVTDLIYSLQDFVKESGDCDHEVGICFCGIHAQIIEGYAILHASGHGDHKWVMDYTWDKDDNIVRLMRCEECYAEKPAT